MDLTRSSVAGDLALDFLNTRMREGGEIVDLLQNGEDVVAWLAQAGLPATRIGSNTMRLPLLRAARELRINIRSLVETRKAGMRGDPSLLNSFLDHAKSRPLLVWKGPFACHRANSPTGLARGHFVTGR